MELGLGAWDLGVPMLGRPVSTAPQVKVVEAQLLDCLGFAVEGKTAAEEICRKLVSAAKEELKAAAIAEGAAGAAVPISAAAAGSASSARNSSSVLLEFQPLPDKSDPWRDSWLVSLVTALK